MKNIKIFLQLLTKAITPPKDGWHYIYVKDDNIVLCVMRRFLYNDFLITEDEFENPEKLCKDIVEAIQAFDETQKKDLDFYNKVPDLEINESVGSVPIVLKNKI